MVQTLRQATLNDIESIVALDYELFPQNNFNERTLSHQLDKGAGWLSFEGEQLTGYMLVNGAQGPLMDILRLGVRESYRRRGFGKDLLQTAIKVSRNGYGVGLMLTVLKTNVPAIRLYRQHGFEITGTMPQHQCWVMQLKKTSS
jgi:ribosomal-protein-alanine N-acetyltransferase